MSLPSGQAEQANAADHGTLIQLTDAAADLEEGAAPTADLGYRDVVPNATAEETQSKTEPSAVKSDSETETPKHDDKGHFDKSDLGTTPNPLDGSSQDAERMSIIQREASEHLAQRAAGMDITDSALVGSGKEKSELPQTPPPPEPPAKDDEKNRDFVSTNKEDFDTGRQGATEPTGAEIQNIMEQFEHGMGGAGEQEIMSPRLERQQSILHLPPRSSSLEQNKEQYISPQTTGHSLDHAISSSGVSVAGSVSGLSLNNTQPGDTASIHSAKGSIFQPPPPSPEPEKELPFDFHRFLEQLRHRTADPVARYLRSFLNEFAKKQWAVHEQVKIISDFLEFIATKMSQCEVWRTVSDAEFDNAREGMEKLVMNRLYTHTFSPAIPSAESPRKRARNGRLTADAASPVGPGRRGQHQEDTERDDVIAQKLRIYGWISEEHLDIKVIGEKGRKFLLLAQQELLKINTYRAPRDKVICVLNCCKVIFGFLKNSKSDQSADAFVPLLIYTVLHAKPEHLVSNVQYIWRFRNQDKLGGEAGYYMSSLMGAVTFVENLDRTNLTISDEEFERNVEQAVSAFAEREKQLEYEEKTHLSQKPGSSSTGPAPMQHLSEKSALCRPEVTPRNSMDAERSSPRRVVTQRLNEKATQSSSMSGPNTVNDDESDAVAGLLRTIQKPLSSIGRIFTEDAQEPISQRPGRSPAKTPIPGATPRGLSPNMRVADRGPSADGRRLSGESERRRQLLHAEDAAARQASAEAEQARKMRVQEHRVVAETLQGMFPNLDKEVIEDVVTAQEGNVGRAVDACLAMSGG